MAKYKVGDKVRIIDDWSKGNGSQNWDGKMDHWLGQVMTIRDIVGTSTYYMVEDKGENGLSGWSWSEKMIAEKVEDGCMNIKETLKTGEFVRMRNGDVALVMRDTVKESDYFMLMSDEKWYVLQDYTDDLKYKYTSEKARDIMEVITPEFNLAFLSNWKHEVSVGTVRWKREEKKKMTVAEIAKALGYDVEIIKG